MPSCLKSIVAFHTQYKQDILSLFQSIFQCEQLSWRWEKSEAGSRGGQPWTFWVQGHHKQQVLLAAPSSASQDSQDLCQHLMLRPNLHTLLGFGAKRLHVNRPEASTQCQQKYRHLSQQKVKDQGMCPLQVNWPQLHVYVCAGERFVTHL